MDSREFTIRLAHAAVNADRKVKAVEEAHRAAKAEVKAAPDASPDIHM